MKTLSVIILSYNTKDLLKKCLESVINCTPTDIKIEIIVVDNASTDGSASMVERNFPEVKLIRSKKNLGYAKGNNLGIRASLGEYVLILNSDTVIKKGAIDKLVNFLEKNKQIDIVGPRLLNVDGSFQANCGRFPNLPVVFVMLFKEHWGSKYVRWSPETSQFVDWLMGAAFMARKRVFEKVGGFDEKIFMYMEEVEWFYRAKKAGMKSYFLKDAEIIHLGRGSSKTGKKEPILNIYRGLIHFYKKHRSVLELIILRFMLKLKAIGALVIGYLTNNNYLKETYGEAFRLV